MQYETGRLPEKGPVTSKRRVRAWASTHTSAPDGGHILAEDVDDASACQIDKTSQGTLTSKWARRKIGGIIAAVTGCRIVVDWDKHQFGEGTAHVYIVLARLVAAIQENNGRLPAVVFFDNACALWRYATNAKRKDRTAISRTMAFPHYMLDIWHVYNQTARLADEASARVLDPRHEDNRELREHVNTEACQQVFSFVDRISYIGMNMGPGTFAVFLYLLFDM